MSAPVTWKRALCWVAGHRWRELRINLDKAMGLAHLHSMAGSDADCTRCGYEWRDFFGFGITPENLHLCKRWRERPELTLVPPEEPPR